MMGRESGFETVCSGVAPRSIAQMLPKFNLGFSLRISGPLGKLLSLSGLHVGHVVPWTGGWHLRLVVAKTEAGNLCRNPP